MANPLIGQILGSVLGRAVGGGGPGGSPAAGMGASGGSGLPGGLGGLGAILGGLGGESGGSVGSGGSAGLPGGMRPAGVGSGSGRNAMLALMLPLVLQWVQRNGGIGNVLQRVNQHGYGGHADSWLGTGANAPLPPQAAHELLGHDELANLSSQLGVGEDEVADGFSEILPEVVDQLSPQGKLPDDADRTLDAGQSALEHMLHAAH
ncbi:YidB family protein [Ramlibacter sp. MMS24-I3-19]|uniref:YidB family protein n=1 Tax=Ramlibacter sp. MMS24-I3-19 TaxID=3416606 RepID=UPI003CFC7084